MWGQPQPQPTTQAPTALPAGRSIAGGARAAGPRFGRTPSGTHGSIYNPQHIRDTGWPEGGGGGRLHPTAQPVHRAGSRALWRSWNTRLARGEGGRRGPGDAALHPAAQPGHRTGARGPTAQPEHRTGPGRGGEVAGVLVSPAVAASPAARPGNSLCVRRRDGVTTLFTGIAASLLHHTISAPAQQCLCRHSRSEFMARAGECRHTQSCNTKMCAGTASKLIFAGTLCRHTQPSVETKLECR